MTRVYINCILRYVFNNLKRTYGNNCIESVRKCGRENPERNHLSLLNNLKTDFEVTIIYTHRMT